MASIESQRAVNFGKMGKKFVTNILHLKNTTELELLI